jgi:recombination protein RecT
MSTTAATQAGTQPETVSQAVARKDNSPAALIKQYSSDFATVLPSHVKAETWVRLAQGALKKGKREKGSAFTDLEIAAANNPGVFLAALLDAARLGLEPGSEQYYLTPRKVNNRLEILGIVGYQGHVELMYRAGAISSVIAEVVYGKDKFNYQPGRDEYPQHEIDWDAEDRGPLRLVYAYARMKDGAVSRVVVLNRADIERIKKSSQGAKSEYSPWVNHEAAMWLKSAVRQLQKWVPTSAEYRRELARASAEAQRVAGDRLPDGPQIPSGVDSEDYLEGQVVEDADVWPPAATPPSETP